MNEFNKKIVFHFRTAVALLVALLYSLDAEGSKTWHDVEVKPNDKKIVAIPIDGPYSGGLRIWPLGGKLICSGIKIQDSTLWAADEKTPLCHIYWVLNAYSGQEFVSITGLVTAAGSGGGKGKLPPFQVTVPEIDVDWEGFGEWEMEKTEDSNLVLLPVATTDAGRRKFFVREPREKDDGMFPPDTRILPDLDLFWSGGIQVYTNNILIPATGIEIKSNKVKTWPLVFYASQNTGIPAPAGELKIRLERRPTEWDVNGEITYDEIKCKTMQVVIEFLNSHMLTGKIIDPLSPPRDVRVGVVQGDTVKFNAKPTPTVTLQNGDYVWTGVQSGNGPEIDITFNSAGTHTEQLQVPGCRACVARTTVVNVTGSGEMAWMAQHPQYWISAFDLRDEALNWAAANWSTLGGSSSVHNCRADAARHAYWNAIMTFDWNAADAEGLATAHEKTGLDDGDSHNETVMDLENNADGRGIEGTNRVALQNAVIGALNAGTLTILDDLKNVNEVGLLQPSNQ